MITFEYLDKSRKNDWLPLLFRLFYENMQKIAPSSLPYGQEEELWLAQVAPALDKEPRKIILCLAGGELAGYVQYYTNGDLLMIEEIQIAEPYRRTTVFCSLCRHLAKELPKDLERVEAFAVKQNLHSQKLMSRLGMVQISQSERLVHLRGSFQHIRKFFQ